MTNKLPRKANMMNRMISSTDRPSVDNGVALIIETVINAVLINAVLINAVLINTILVNTVLINKSYKTDVIKSLEISKSKTKVRKHMSW